MNKILVLMHYDENVLAASSLVAFVSSIQSPDIDVIIYVIYIYIYVMVLVHGVWFKAAYGQVYNIIISLIIVQSFSRDINN